MCATRVQYFVPGKYRSQLAPKLACVAHIMDLVTIVPAASAQDL
jgi:hypothetical protein